MADNEPKSVIVLTVGKPITVTQSIDEILNAIEGVTSRHIPLITVTEISGVEHRINANQIVEFHQPPE
jgi:uncharacterized protein YlzI (FlbEa/FlbD family)